MRLDKKPLFCLIRKASGACLAGGACQNNRMEFAVILKFQHVEKDDLAAIAKHADETVRHYVTDESNFQTGAGGQGVRKKFRAITLRKVTPVTDELDLPGTIFSIDLEVKRETVDDKGRPMPTPLQWVTRIFEILERFPASEDDEIVLEPRDQLKDEDVQLVVRETPDCPNCGHKAVRNGSDYRCNNCGQFVPVCGHCNVNMPVVGNRHRCPKCGVTRARHNDI